ncbi:hypothetical protein JHD50_10840 [Sulfurimonas sp. MAG313]|nr:SiaB family protein kinase [Sulfurimonas sp. MAG313]MDF1881788.1 hypothetical protein [Sulfurimonas sp. MAG313]
MNLNRLDEELHNDGIVFLAYDGFITQALIVAMTEALEKESDNLGLTTSTNILTIFIELTQNMMNYSKSQKKLHCSCNGKGMILVGYINESHQYYVMSRNVIIEKDKDYIQSLLEKIVSLDAQELRNYYRELRKLGKTKHEKGAGIGFIEIARKCEKIIYDFEAVDDIYNFTFKAILKKEKNAKLEN